MSDLEVMIEALKRTKVKVEKRTAIETDQSARWALLVQEWVIDEQLNAIQRIQDGQ